MSFDHRLQHIAAGKSFLLRARQIIGEGQDTAEIVRRMAPFGGEPGIIEIQLADHRADIESSVHRVELPCGAGNAGAVNQSRAGNDGP
jgi:hypothetical protein